MTVKHIVLVGALALAVLGCRRTDVRAFTIDVPQAMAADMAAIRASLVRYGGVDAKSIAFDEAAHKIRLRYDSMQIARKNIEMAIAEVGFAANGVTPESIGAKAAR